MHKYLLFELLLLLLLTNAIRCLFNCYYLLRYFLTVTLLAVQAIRRIKRNAFKLVRLQSFLMKNSSDVL